MEIEKPLEKKEGPFFLRPKLCPLINKTCLDSFCQVWNKDGKKCGLMGSSIKLGLMGAVIGDSANQLKEIANNLKKFNAMFDCFLDNLKRNGFTIGTQKVS